MLINSAQIMPSIERRISIELRNPAYQLSANIMGGQLPVAGPVFTFN